MTPLEKRAKLGHLMDLLVQYAPAVHYAQHRPMRSRFILSEADLIRDLRSPNGIWTDCSETVTLICRLAGLLDPNGTKYDGYGNTGTMWAHLPHYGSPSLALVGGLAVFGPQGADHVVMVRHRGDDPVVFSHGGEPGPVFERLSRVTAALRAPRQMLSIAPLL